MEHHSLAFCCSVAQSCLTLFATPWTAAPRLLCPSPSPGACSNSCPWSWWCHLTVWSSVLPFSSCLKSFPASGSFPVSQLFASGGQSTKASVSASRSFPKSQFFTSGSQSIGVSASESVIPINTQDWFPLGLTGWNSLQPCNSLQGTLKSLLQHHSSKVSILWHSAFFIVQLSHPYMTTRKTIALTRWTFVGKVMSLLSNMLSRLLITFLPRSKHLLISWLQSPSAMILGPKKIKSLTVCIVSPSICHEVMGPAVMILVF